MVVLPPGVNLGDFVRQCLPPGVSLGDLWLSLRSVLQCRDARDLDDPSDL